MFHSPDQRDRAQHEVVGRRIGLTAAGARFASISRISGSICATTSAAISSCRDSRSLVSRSNRRAQTIWLLARRSSSRRLMRILLPARCTDPSSRKSKPNSRRIAASSRLSGCKPAERIGRHDEHPPEPRQGVGDFVRQSQCQMRVLAGIPTRRNGMTPIWAPPRGAVGSRLRRWRKHLDGRRILGAATRVHRLRPTARSGCAPGS